MSSRERSSSGGGSSSSSSSDSGDLEAEATRSRANDLKQRLLRKLYPAADAQLHSLPAAPAAEECAANRSTSSCPASAERHLPGQRLGGQQQQRVYTAAAGPMLLPAADYPVAACASPAAADVRSSEQSVAVSSSESSDDGTASRSRRRRRGRNGKRFREARSSSSNAEPEAKSPACEAEPLASCSCGLSKNRKRKMKKRRRREAQRHLAANADMPAARTEAKEFFYDDTAEVNERRLVEERNKASIIEELQDFVSSIADMHAYESHVSWSSTLDSLEKQTALLDLDSLGSLHLIKTLLLLNDKERSRDAITLHLGGTSPLSPDVKDMLTILFNYWLASVMA